MNEFTKEDLIYGFIKSPEYYNECIYVPLTKKQKQKIFISKIKEIIIELLWCLLQTSGIILQLVSFAYLAGIFFHIGYKS